jgi:iron complex outermembrane receptor protein
LRFVAGARYTTEKKNLDGLSTVFLDICTNPAVPIPACPGAPLFPVATTLQHLIGNMGLIQVAPGPAPIYIQPTAQAANTIFQNLHIPIDDSLTTDKTTFRLAIEYDLAAQSLLYASFEDGFHAGGFAFAQSEPTFRPEEIDAWTIGSKNRFFSGTVQVNAEAFLWKYKDQQISHFITDTSGADVFATTNAGRSTNKGVELDVHYKPMPNTLLGLDAQYLKATYDEFEYTAPTAPSPLITGCLTTPSGTNQAVVNCSGKTALHSPEWTVNVGLEQRFPVGSRRIAFAVNTHYQTRNVIGFEMLPGISEQAAYSMTALSLDFGADDDKWNVGLFVNNVEDRHPIGQSFYNSAVQTYAASPLPPRTFGLRAMYVW